MRDNPLIASLCALTLILLLWQWSQPYPMPDSQNVIPPELPVAPSHDNAGLLERLIKHNLWDKNRGLLGAGAETNTSKDSKASKQQQADAEKARKAEQYADWRLMGVSVEGGKQLAVISAGDEITTYQSGEQLPDGTKIIQVMPYGVRVIKLGKEQSVYLFGKK